MATNDSSSQSISPKQARFAEGCFWLLCAYPLLWLSQLYMVGICTWLRLGYWPNFNHPVAKSIDGLVGLQMVSVFLGVPLLWTWPFVCPAWTVVLVRVRLWKFHRHIWGLLMAIVGGALCVWQVQVDPTGLWNWFWD